MSTERRAPPEARLVQLARQAQGLSPEKIAKGMHTGKRVSGRYWRQIEEGKVAPAATLAHMAFAAGVTPESLQEAGRNDAAEVLRQIDLAPFQQTAGPPDDEVFSDPKERALWELEALTYAEKVDHIAKVRVNRVTQQEREEIERLNTEMARLRQENAELRAELERGQARRAG